MSDPMTNMSGDEDVLASIRRLVVDSRAARERMAAATPSAANGPSNKSTGAPELFLLTTDFLVEKQPAPSEAVVEIPPLILGPELAVVKPTSVTVTSKDDAIDAVSVPRGGEAGEAGGHSVEAGVEAASAEAEEAAVGDAGGEEEAAAAEHRSLEDARAAWPAHFDDTPDGAAAEHAARLSLEQRIAELESAVGAVEGDWEPDGSENLEGEIPRQLPRGFADIVLNMRAKPSGEDAAVEDATDPDTQDPEQGDAACVAGHFDDRPERETEAEADDGLDVSLADLVGEDGCDEVADTPPLAEAVTEPLSEASEPRDAHMADEDLLDEHMLRAIVSDVLNEELRGQLGERMTRNIRRLVRREVQRALSMRDLH